MVEVWSDVRPSIQLGVWFIVRLPKCGGVAKEEKCLNLRLVIDHTFGNQETRFREKLGRSKLQLPFRSRVRLSKSKEELKSKFGQAFDNQRCLIWDFEIKSRSSRNDIGSVKFGKKVRSNKRSYVQHPKQTKLAWLNLSDRSAINWLKKLAIGVTQIMGIEFQRLYLVERLGDTINMALESGF